MSKEDPRNIFQKILKTRNDEIEAERISREKVLSQQEMEKVRLYTRFDQEIEHALLKAEEELLSQDPISSIVSVLEAAADSIDDTNSNKLYRVRFFKVDGLGSHPLNDTWIDKHHDEKALFVKEIEGGKSITSVIDSVYLQYGTSNPGSAFLHATINGIKNQLLNGELHWQIGEETGDIKLKRFDIQAFANLLATKVSLKQYYLPPMEPWSIN
jgi:hypothetical protein